MSSTTRTAACSSGINFWTKTWTLDSMYSIQARLGVSSNSPTAKTRVQDWPCAVTTFLSTFFSPIVPLSFSVFVRLWMVIASPSPSILALALSVNQMFEPFSSFPASPFPSPIAVRVATPTCCPPPPQKGESGSQLTQVKP